MRSFPRILPLFFTLALCTTTFQLQAKTGGRIVGKVKAPDGAGLLGAVVTIFKQDNRGGTISFTRSDRTGAYAITNLSPGAYYVQVTRDGYQPITNSNVKIAPGKTTAVDIVLQEFLDFVVGVPDARNWDVKAVMRSTSDRRLIFRHAGDEGESASLPSGLPVDLGDGFTPSGRFARGAAVNVASSSALSSENYAVFPSFGHNGIVSNFAFAEPVGAHARMIFSGQLNSGYDSLWRVRNTFHYRPESGRDLKFSMGYGRLSLNGPNIGNVVGRPTQFFAQDAELRESGAQTVVVGMEARNKVLDPVELEYGFDYSRVHFGSTKGVFSPHLQVVITPAESWTLRAGMTSRRVSDNSLVMLPDGDLLNLMEPTYLAQIDGELHLSEFKHTEASLAKALADETFAEVAVYQDRMEGPGTPFVVTRRTSAGRHNQVAQIRQDQAGQRGLRVAMNHRFLDFLSGSIAYVYGSATTLASPDETFPSEILARRLLDHMQRSYFHGLTSQVDARFPRTKTQVTTIVRWHPGYTLTPIDPFADRKDTLTKSVNFFVRQVIPLPEFMGTVGRWEALLDVRNLLDQGREHFRTTDGDLILSRNPRAVRFGLNLNFY